jgi:hypothetical protein
MSRVEVAATLNLALLATHQVDAAFWHEWEVFGVPGGIHFFLAFNLLAVFGLALGLVTIAKHGKGARLASRLSAGLGLVTVAIHAVFLVLDPVAFWDVLSISILVATGLNAGWLLSVSRSAEGERDDRTPR